MLYLVTNRSNVKKDYYEIIEEAVSGGVDVIILREKTLSYDELLIKAKRMKEIMGRKENGKLIINSNVAVAKAVMADGCHFTFNDFIHTTYNDGLKGVSIHSLQEAIMAEKNGAHYLMAGHIFSTNSKLGLQPRGIEWLKEIIEGVSIPVIPIGGINLTNIKELISFPVGGVAVMSLIMEADNPFGITKELKSFLRG